MRRLMLAAAFSVVLGCGSEEAANSTANNAVNGNPDNSDPTNVEPNADPNDNPNTNPNGDPNANPNGDPNANPNGDPNGNPNNVTPGNNTPGNNTTGPNNTTGANNTTGTNNTTNNSGVVMDTEPNDDPSTAQPITVGDTIAGTATAGELDFFSFVGAQGSIIEVEILSGDSSLDVVIMVQDELDAVGDRVLRLNPGAKRQFFLPSADTWHVLVFSLDADDRAYEFVVRDVTPNPIVETFADTVVGDLNDGAVDIYALPDADGLILAAVEAERLANPSDFDSMMFVYSPNAGLVAFNDDYTAGGTFDSELDFTATAGETYWLVVDAWDLGANNPYELTVLLP